MPPGPACPGWASGPGSPMPCLVVPGASPLGSAHQLASAKPHPPFCRSGAAVRGPLNPQRQPQPTGRERAERSSAGPRGTTGSSPGAGAARGCRRWRVAAAAGRGGRSSAHADRCGSASSSWAAGAGGSAARQCHPWPASRGAALCASPCCCLHGGGASGGQGGRGWRGSGRGGGGQGVCPGGHSHVPSGRRGDPRRAAPAQPGRGRARRLRDLPPRSKRPVGWRGRAGQHPGPAAGSPGLGSGQRRRHARLGAWQHRRQRRRVLCAAPPACWVDGQRSRATAILCALQEPLSGLDSARWAWAGLRWCARGCVCAWRARGGRWGPGATRGCLPGCTTCH